MAMEPRLVRCMGLGDGHAVGDWFKANEVVDMLMDETPSDEARRLKDFASGLVYAAGGTMEKIGPGLYRLSPSTRDGGTSGDREPRRPTPLAGADAIAMPVPYAK